LQWLLVEQELTCASEHLLVDPVLLAALPAAELLGLEPESNLLIRGLNSVRTVTDVAANLDAEISPDGAGGGVGGVGGAEHHAAGLDGIETLPDHSEHGTTAREQGRDKY